MRKHWWGRVVFPGKSLWWSYWGMAPETGLVFGTFWGMIWLLYVLVIGNAEAIHAGKGERVRLTLAGNAQPLSGDARLLGTSNAFVFVYWPEGKRAEALPIESVARIESLRPLAAPPPLRCPRHASRPSHRAERPLQRDTADRGATPTHTGAPTHPPMRGGALGAACVISGSTSARFHSLSGFFTTTPTTAALCRRICACASVAVARHRCSLSIRASIWRDRHGQVLEVHRARIMLGDRRRRRNACRVVGVNHRVAVQ